MNLIHVEDNQWTSPESAASYEGNTYLVSGKPCYADPGDRRARVSDIRRRALAAGNRELKVFSKWRPDLIGFHRGTTRPEGWKPEWTMRLTDWDMIREKGNEWSDAGSPIHMDSKASQHPDYKAHVYSGDGFPQIYTGGHGRGYAFVADLRIPEYQDFCVDHLVQHCETYSLDGVLMDNKMGWHSHGSPAISTPREGDKGGPVFVSPCAPGEWELAYSILIYKLFQVGIRPVLITRPGIPGQGKWDFMPGWFGIEDMPLGEYG